MICAKDFPTLQSVGATDSSIIFRMLNRPKGLAMAKPITIGRLSQRTGVHIETIRYYEKIGLLTDPPRSAGGHRQYDLDSFKRLNFVSRCRRLGFSLAEIANLLSLVADGDYSCRDIQRITLAHKASIRTKINDLRRLEASLTQISKDCEGGNAADCPIVDALFDQNAP